MKRKLAFVLALVMTLTLAACGGEKAPAELTVFAAASMQETLTEIGEQYMKEHEGVEIVFNFDSSGTLKTQIQEGAECDIFISAGQKQMNQLDKNASPEVNTEGLDFVLEGTRFDLLENKVALAVPEGNPKNINSYGDLKAGLEAGTVLLAMGNADVPVGQYTQKILAYFGLEEAALAEAAVDCGIIYSTDAFSAGLTVVDTATAEMCGQVIYPAAVLNTSKNPEAAKDFLAYVTSDAGKAVLESVGFAPLG